jgi:hypothetical protein
MPASDARLWALARAIVAGDAHAVSRLLAESPVLAREPFTDGATRAAAKANFIAEIRHYVYAGDTALHVAAAAHRPALARALLAQGADVRARNRRGAEPLHYAADGWPGWRPSEQAGTIRALIEAGADPNATDKGGVAPLHRAVRNRCAAAVEAFLDGGADPRLPNGSGSTPLQLARLTTGRGGSGSPEAKEQQAQILRMLTRAIDAWPPVPRDQDSLES